MRRIPDEILKLNAREAPYLMNIAATMAGLTNLDDLPQLQTHINLLKKERDRLYTSLRRVLHLSAPSNQANLALCKIDSLSASSLRRSSLSKVC